MSSEAKKTFYDSIGDDISITYHEKECLNAVLDCIIRHNGNISMLSLERRSKDYLSVICCQNDFLRIKATKRALWFSFDAWAIKHSGFESLLSPLTSIAKNTNQRHWKILLANPSDILNYSEYIFMAYSLSGGKEI